MQYAQIIRVRGFHSSPSPLKLSLFDTETTQYIPQKVLPMILKVDEWKPLGTTMDISGRLSTAA